MKASKIIISLASAALSFSALAMNGQDQGQSQWQGKEIRKGCPEQVQHAQQVQTGCPEQAQQAQQSACTSQTQQVLEESSSSSSSSDSL